MMLLVCPWCGPRDAGEFHCAGEQPDPVDPKTATLQQWRAQLYLRDNPADWTIAWWFHRLGCRRWLSVERHTVTGQVRSVRDIATGKSWP